MSEEATPATLRRRRGVVRASITRLSSRLNDLEGKTDQATTHDITQRTSLKLTKLDSEFKTYHYRLIDLIDDDDTLEREQAVLDEHDELHASPKWSLLITRQRPENSLTSKRV